ncbi:hypothetical protein [Noviherbaspirillum aridicola]|uniref:Uncharacterized protein n=1 Tax=Noviherbaspirillum aridicola TaxID=2849687 RepID=A0ABQ4Q2U0_9BURK|nr:hypothetical protein [Noviherbaspirillum aridicola]GIZ51362.1 hypothetical protein NCCP691_13760 [Noviherbaspirillum aridicola]
MIPLRTIPHTPRPSPPATASRADNRAAGKAPVERSTLSRFEQSRIDKAIRTAFESLPATLVREMANIPPATREVALLLSPTGDEGKLNVTVHGLERDRENATGMIALHTVLRRVTEARNRFWTRDARERMRNAIDNYARTAILRELRHLEQSDAAKMKEAAAAVASKGVSHYAIGVSKRETSVLHALSADVMRAAEAGTPPSPEDRQAYHSMSVKDASLVYTTLDEAMVKAFREVFTAYDEKVRNRSLAGVDHAVLRELASFLPPVKFNLKVQKKPEAGTHAQAGTDAQAGTNPQAGTDPQTGTNPRAETSPQAETGPQTDASPQAKNEWVEQQKAVVAQALDGACARLPERLRAYARHAYIQQFLRPCDMNDLAPFSAALWEIRSKRRRQAERAKPLYPARTETDAWIDSALRCLRAVIEEHDGSLMAEFDRPEPPAIRGNSAAGSRQQQDDAITAVDDGRAREASSAVLSVHAGNMQQDDAITPVGGGRAGEAGSAVLPVQAGKTWPPARKTRGTFRDLREAYESNRAGVPWHDTRAQESIEKIAAPALKKLFPQDRAAVLEALTAYGDSATRFLLRKHLRVASRPRNKVVISEKRRKRIFVEADAQRGDIPPKHSERYPPADAGFRIWHSEPSETQFRSTVRRGKGGEPKIIASPSPELTADMKHEIGHAVDCAIVSDMGLHRFNPDRIPTPYPLSFPFTAYDVSLILRRKNAYSRANREIKREHARAARDRTGISRYAETDTFEFFAEAMSAYVGSPDTSFETNVRKERADVYSPENLREQHPRTYAIIDELIRAGMNHRRAERSVAGKTSIGDKLRRQWFDTTERLKNRAPDAAR